MSNTKKRMPWFVKLAAVIVSIPILGLLGALIWGLITAPLDMLLIFSIPTAFFGFMWAAFTLSDWSNGHYEVDEGPRHYED